MAAERRSMDAAEDGERASGLAAGGFDGARGSRGGRSSKGWTNSGMGSSRATGSRDGSGSGSGDTSAERRTSGAWSIRAGSEASAGSARGVGTGAGRGDAGGPVSGTRRVSTGGAGVGASIGPAGAAVLVAKDVGPPSFLMPKVLFTSRPNFPMAPTGGASWCSLGRLPGLRARSDVERIHGRGTCESSRTHRPAAKDVRCDDVENSRREEHDTCASVRFGVARNATRI